MLYNDKKTSNGLKKILISIISILIIFVIFSHVSFAEEVGAGTPGGGAEEQMNPNSMGGRVQRIGSEAGYAPANGETLIDMISLIIKSIISLLGIIFIILIIISGFQWMLSNGNEEVISKAKQRIKNLVIGLGIIFLSFAISMFIFDVLMQ